MEFPLHYLVGTDISPSMPELDGRRVGRGGVFGFRGGMVQVGGGMQFGAREVEERDG